MQGSVVREPPSPCVLLVGQTSRMVARIAASHYCHWGRCGHLPPTSDSHRGPKDLTELEAGGSAKALVSGPAEGPLCGTKVRQEPDRDVT